MTRPVRVGLGLVVAALAALGLVAIDAHRRARAVSSLEIALVAATGSADLALSSSASWLRHPSVAEPAAACIGPTCLDTDPAGLAIPPRRAGFASPVVVSRVPE